MKNFILIVLLFLIYPSFSHAEIAVVASASASISSADAAELKRLYLGKTKTLSGVKVTAINQTNSNEISSAFNQAVLQKSGNQLKAYWSKLVFTGKGTPPKELDGDAAVIAALKDDSSAVGYIDSASVTGDVKVLLTL